MNDNRKAGNHPPRISVVVITHNNDKHVSQCLDSLLGQTLQPDEIIVCDDASKDGTRGILEEYVERFPAIVRLVKHSVNVGIPANLNSGFRVAKGEFISLIAGDDIWLPEKLEKEYQRLQETGAAWVYSKVVLYWDDLVNPARTKEFWGTEPGFEGDVFERVLRREMSLRNYLLRRDALESLGFFDECVGMYEDWDFNIRMSKTYPIAHVPDRNVVYLIHGGGEHHAPMYRHMAEINKVLRKNSALIPEGMGDIARETIQRFWPEQTMSTERDKAAYRMALGSLDLPYVPAKIESDGEGLIFLVSLPRSGSTMLQRVLGSHPDIHTAAEPWVMLNPLYALKQQGVSAEYDAMACRKALGEFLDQLPGDEENYYDSVRQMGQVLYSRAVRFSGKSRFLDKTPRYFYVLNELVRTFPKAKIVLLLRNPLAVLASVLETWFHKSIAEFENSNHYKDMIEGPALLARAIEQFGDNVLVTRYEEYTTGCEDETARICEFLGLPYFPPMLEYGKNPSPTGTFGDPEKVNLHSAPVDSYADTWKDVFDTDELHCYAQSYVERLGDQVLDTLGYPKQAMLKSVSADTVSLNDAGEEAFIAGDLERAETLFTRACRMDPGNPEIFSNLVVLYWQKGEAGKSLEYLADGLLLDNTDRNLVINGGQILVELDQVGEARQLYSGYLASHPDDVDVIELLSAISSEQQSPEKHESGENRAVDKLIADGEAAFSQGDINEAIALFEEAVKADPANTEIYNNLGVAYWRLGDPNKAIECLVEALELDPDSRDAIINAGKVLSALGKDKEAAALCLSYLEQFPDDDEVSGMLMALSPEAQDAGSHPIAKSVVPDADIEAPGGEVISVDFSLQENISRAPRISVVIPSFNQGAYLETTIRSVLDQNYPNLELIIMDGGSTDNSGEIIRKYEGRISYWQSQPDDGQYWAVNEGFKYSTGEVMTWINSDDKLHPNSLNTVATIFAQSSDVEWVTGTPNVMNEAGIIKWICSPIPVFSHQNYLEKKYDVPSYIQQEGTFWRRSLWEKSGSTLRTKLQMAGDLELWARFFRYAPLHTLNVCTGCFREHKNQKTAKAMTLYRAEAEQVLDSEADLFNTNRKRIIKPVAPIMVKSAAQSVKVNRFVRKSVEKELLGKAVRLDTYSALPGREKQNASSNAMHGRKREILVTAIVSTYNSEKYLAGCLQDLEAQTIADQLEIIVVDSGSQQDEASIVKEFQQRFTNIRYIRTEARETIYSAWNRAAREARGKYLTNANTDDRHCSDAFERMLHVLEGDDGVALVYADAAVTEQENAGFDSAPITACFRWPEYDAKHLFSVCYIGPQPMWHRSLHEKYGYFEASLRVAGDYDFWLRMAPHERFAHIPDVLGLYLSSKDSIEHAFSGIGAQESEQSRVKHWPSEWGKRPALSKGYLVPVDSGDATVSALMNAEADMPCNQPLVSVIIATKDREVMLGYALRSLEQQTYRNWEAIVINDGGVDVSEVISHVDSKSRIRYLQNPVSLGQAKARNRALKSASGDIVTFLDDDDIYLPDHLATVARALNADDQQMFVYTDAYMVQETLKNGVRREVRRSRAYAHGDYSRKKLHTDNYIPINTWAFRRVCLENTGYFDETMNCCEDWEFLLRLAQEYNFTHIQSATVEVHHRVDVIDNVTRLRLDETVSSYEYIYSKYSDFDSDSVRQGRKKAISGLREKSERQEAKRLHEGVNPGRGNDGDYLLADDARQMEIKRSRFIERISQADYLRPAVHFAVVVGSDDMDRLGDTLESLGQQIYSGWGLSVISTEDMPSDEFASLDAVEWLKVESADTALHGVLSGSEADWLVVLNVGDKLSPYALSNFVDYINLHPDWTFVYTDESLMDEYGGLTGSLFKPDINLDYLCSDSYIGDFCLFRKDMFSEVNGAACKPGLVSLDVCLRVIEQRGESAVGHIASVLNSRCMGQHTQPLKDELRDVLAAHLLRSGTDARVIDGFVDDTFMIDYQVRKSSKVCVVIDARNNTDQAQATLNSLLAKTDYENFNVRVAVSVSGGSGLENVQDKRVHLDSVNDSLSRADYVGRMAEGCDADYLLFVEPGVLAVQSSWLQRMLAQVQRDEIGMVGVRLISQEKRVVHAGIVTGVGSFSVGACVFDGISISDPGYMNRALVAQNMSAVSSACMMVETSLFLRVGGFDRKVDVPLYQDVDLCQRVLNENRKIVWTPFVSMLYVGHSLDGYKGDGGLSRVRKDSEYVSGRWLKSFARDVAYNRNLGMKQLDFEVDELLVPEWDPEIIETPAIMGFGVGSYGSWQYRVVQPLGALQKAGAAQCINMPFSNRNQILLPTPVEMERMQPDVLLMHNTLHDNYIEALEKYKKVNKTFIVFGQDDLMSALPPTNPFSKTIYKDVKKRIRKCLSLADRLLVTTDPLAQGLRGMVDDILIVPNYIDEAVWGNLQSQRGVSSKPRVGWAGAQQHMGDLRLLEEVVRETASEVDWVFFGMCPDFLEPFVKEVHDPVLFELYPEKLAEMNLDLAVAPLERNKFNESKSNLRLLEYGILGWPVIASDVEPYRDAPVCRVTNQARAWINAIRERIDDLDAAYLEGDMLRNWVHENWILQSHANVWLDALNPSCKAGNQKKINRLAASS